MNQIRETLVEALRGEIVEHGRLIGLLEEQLQLIFRGDPAGILELGAGIQRQVDAVATCRRARERAVAAFAAANGQPAGATLRSLLPFCTVETRPLMEELIANANRLIHRVRRGSRQNHRMLQYRVEIHQELLRRLRPDAFTKTYAPDGRVSVAALRPAPSIRSAG